MLAPWTISIFTVFSAAARDAAFRRHFAIPASPSVVEIDALLDNDVAIVVLDDVVAVQAVAILVEIVDSLDAAIALHGEQRVADLLRVDAARPGARLGENMDRGIGPWRKKIRRGLVAGKIFFRKRFGFGVCPGMEVGD